MLAFGSYKLGVQFPFTDIDLICVFSSYIYKDDFFEDFKTTLLQTPGISHVLDVVDAKVPILKIQFNGYHIDLLYACLDYFPSDIEKAIRDEQFFNKLN